MFLSKKEHHYLPHFTIGEIEVAMEMYSFETKGNKK